MGTEEIKVLDHGFVRLVDSMGTDSRIVQAARVSYGKGTKTVNEDEQLIRYLFRHEHTSPFEMCEVLIHCKMPMFVARQWIRHRTASVNEVSGRYSEVKDEYYLPESWRKQSKNNKQGSEETDEIDLIHTHMLYQNSCTGAFQVYNELLENNVGKEMARMNLPLSTYTEWYWKIDLKNLLHFLKLRLDSHAQYEIRVYAEAIAQIVKELFPVTWKAFEDYQLKSIRFSKQELAVLKLIDLEQIPELETLMKVWETENGTINKLEVIEFKEKLNNL